MAKEKEEKESAPVSSEKEKKTSPKDAKAAAKKAKQKSVKPSRKSKNKQPFLARRLHAAGRITNCRR